MTNCQTCEYLLGRLFQTSERLFEVSSDLSLVVLAWRPGKRANRASKLIAEANSLRVECSAIREELDAHRLQTHAQSAIACGLTRNPRRDRAASRDVAGSFLGDGDSMA
jgi:hypothetical protein